VRFRTSRGHRDRDSGQRAGRAAEHSRDVPVQRVERPDRWAEDRRRLGRRRHVSAQKTLTETRTRASCGWSTARRGRIVGPPVSQHRVGTLPPTGRRARAAAARGAGWRTSFSGSRLAAMLRFAVPARLSPLSSRRGRRSDREHGDRTEPDQREPVLTRSASMPARLQIVRSFRRFSPLRPISAAGLPLGAQQHVGTSGSGGRAGTKCEARSDSEIQTQRAATRETS
jgi:hypothetical protein